MRNFIEIPLLPILKKTYEAKSVHLIFSFPESCSTAPCR